MDTKSLYQNTVGAVVIVETNDGGGTGFFFCRGGWILTNRHVVHRAENITVRTYSQQKAVAHVVSWDRECDLAVLRVPDFSSLDHAVLSLNSDEAVAVGEEIIAIGHPDNLAEFTLSKGTISALERKVAHQTSFLQMNMSVNWGNSGGPVLASSGRVVGITTQIVYSSDRERRIEGASVAVPAKSILAFIEPLSRIKSEALAELRCCFVCGACVPVDEKFCSHCGNRMPSVSAEVNREQIAFADVSGECERVCVACGVPFGRGQKYCNNCGKRF